MSVCLKTYSKYFGRKHRYHKEKHIESVLDASQEAGLEVNPEKTKYMLMSHYQKTGQQHSIKMVKIWQSSDIWQQH
jgi:hypothetical protein